MSKEKKHTKLKRFLVKCLLKLLDELGLLMAGLFLWCIDFAGITFCFYYGKKSPLNGIFFWYIMGYIILYILTLHFIKWLIGLNASELCHIPDPVNVKEQAEQKTSAHEDDEIGSNDL